MSTKLDVGVETFNSGQGLNPWFVRTPTRNLGPFATERQAIAAWRDEEAYERRERLG